VRSINELPVSKKRAVYSFLFPFFFILVLWLVFFVSETLHIDLMQWGIFPRRLSGLKGILFAPFIHGSLRHLANNSLPLFFLMAGTIYFYRDLGYKVILYIWLMGGSWVWIAARPAYHIGASGIIYGLAAFLFFSGILRNYVPLIAISLLVVFLYGSMIWGVFPLLKEISWESHFLGALAGVILAVIYRHEGPQRPPPSWELEEQNAGEKDPSEEQDNTGMQF
jgi:membrane associated rhomboid family serine protease